MNEVVEKVKQKLTSKFEVKERRWYERKLNSVKHTYFKNELRYYDIMKDFDSEGRITKYDFIDQ